MLMFFTDLETWTPIRKCDLLLLTPVTTHWKTWRDLSDVSTCCGEVTVKGDICKEAYLMFTVLWVEWPPKKDPYMWNFARDICQPVTCQPTFLHFQRHLWSTVSLSAWLSVNLCEQPACRQLNNQTSHQTCSALTSGRAAVRGEGGNRAMEPWMQEKVVERERTGRVSVLAPLGEGGGGLGGGSACLAIKNLFKGERLHTICLPKRERRQGGILFFLLLLLFFLFSNKDKEKSFKLLVACQPQRSGWLDSVSRI